MAGRDPTEGIAWQGLYKIMANQLRRPLGSAAALFFCHWMASDHARTALNASTSSHGRIFGLAMRTGL